MIEFSEKKTLKKHRIIKGKCAICGKSYHTIIPTRKYCSAICRYKNYRERHCQQLKNKREYMKEYTKEWREKHPEYMSKMWRKYGNR